MDSKKADSWSGLWTLFVPSSSWLLPRDPFGFSWLELRVFPTIERTEARKNWALKCEHLSLFRSEMKPEIFNEGKFVQCGKQFRGKIETIILTWPLRMWPFYLLTTFKYNKEFEYLKSNFNIWNFHFFALKMSKQDISAFWELLSLPLSLENENFQPVLIVHVAPWYSQPRAERERWQTALGPVTPNTAIPFLLPLPNTTYYWIGCGGRGG